MLVLATSMPVTRTREKAIETGEIVEIAKAVKTARDGKNGEESKEGENPRSNLEQILCIQYLINFKKKSV